jgi:hypothetical protein
MPLTPVYRTLDWFSSLARLDVQERCVYHKTDQRDFRFNFSFDNIAQNFRVEAFFHQLNEKEPNNIFVTGRMNHPRSDDRPTTIDCFALTQSHSI